MLLWWHSNSVRNSISGKSFANLELAIHLATVLLCCVKNTVNKDSMFLEKNCSGKSYKTS